jgi:arabinose-5-phosphate isomerase
MEIEELQSVASRLNDSFDKAVNLMTKALDTGHKIVVVGVGKSGNIGQKIVATLNSTGAPTVMLDSQNALHGDLGVVCDGDVCIAMSFSGETAELLNLLPFLKRFDMQIIGMTGHMGSSLAKYSDIVLDTGVTREACPLNLAPTSSSTAMLVMGDALAMALLEERHFTAEDFAKRHPGGALGRALLTKVSDIMRRPPEIAILSETASVNECLTAMINSRAGASILIKEDGKLAGVFTHGDFVRAYQKDAHAGELPVANLMTREPVFVFEDELATQAIRALGSRRIDDLVVLNKQRKPVGLVDTQDLARLKLV